MDWFIQQMYRADSKMQSMRGDKVDSKKLPVSEQERALAEQNWNAYIRARDNGHTDWVKIARRCDAYYSGDQWEQNVVDQLDAELRPHLTINQSSATINAVLSEHVRTRQEISFAPRGRGATQEVADALAFVSKQVQYNNKSKWVEQDVVADGLIQDRGYFDIRIDFSDNIQGEIREVARDPLDVLLDPAAKDYDPSTWSEVTTTRWLTPDEISVMYGEGKAALLRDRAATYRFSNDSIEFDTGTRSYGDTEQNSYIYTDADMATVRRIRVIERQWKKLSRRSFFVDPEEGDMRPVPDNWDAARVLAFAQKYDLEILERPERRIRWTCSADDVLLYDDWSLYNRFTIFPFFPYFRRGKPTGLMRHLISPQDMLNKITSQELHVVNTTANSGWIFEQGSLINMDADDLERIGAKTGLVLEYKRGTTMPEKIQPNQIPSGLDNIATKAQIYFHHISGLPETFVGGSSREISGVAVEQLNQAGAGTLDVVWDNLAKTQRYRAEFYLELMQQWYTEHRLIRITELDEDGRPQERTLEINKPDEESPEGQILNNLSLGEYEVTAVSMPAHETQQDTVFAQAIQLREAGIAIPDFVLIENSRLPNKREISELVKKLQNMADPTPEEVQMHLMQQQLTLQEQQARVSGLLADAKYKEAQAEAVLAKADAATQSMALEAQKEGARMRVELEKMQATLQQAIMDIQARLAIAREKSDTLRYQAQLDSMSKRTSKLLDLANRAQERRNRPPNGR